MQTFLPTEQEMLSEKMETPPVSNPGATRFRVAAGKSSLIRTGDVPER